MPGLRIKISVPGPAVDCAMANAEISQPLRIVRSDGDVPSDAISMFTVFQTYSGRGRLDQYQCPIVA